jgi:hypothetical protein
MGLGRVADPLGPRLGKTRTGAEWIRAQMMAGCSRLALVGATAADVRDMVEGESGIMAVSPSHDRPEYQPGLRRLTWLNGAMATCYSADEPDRLRLQRSEPVLGDGKAAFRAVRGLDPEGIVAKRLADAYCPRTKWWKILNGDYSQKAGRAELFERR